MSARANPREDLVFISGEYWLPLTAAATAELVEPAGIEPTTSSLQS